MNPPKKPQPNKFKKSKKFILKKSTTFDIASLLYAAKHKMLKEIALYYAVKAKFHHSIIYGYNPHKLAELVGVHHKTAERYVKKLIKEEFCLMRDGNLLFRASNKVFVNKEFRKSKINLKTRPYTSYKGILRRIQTVLLLNNKQQQKFKIASRYGNPNVVKGLNERTKRKALRLYRLEAKQEVLELENIEKPIISVFGASKLFNVSKGTSLKILSELKRLNYLEMKPYIRAMNKTEVRKSDSKYFPKFGHLFFRGNYPYIYYGREITRGDYLRN